MLREESRSREWYTSSCFSLDNSGNTSNCNLFPLHPINSSFAGQSVTTAASQIKPGGGWQKEREKAEGREEEQGEDSWSEETQTITLHVSNIWYRLPGKWWEQHLVNHTLQWFTLTPRDVLWHNVVYNDRTRQYLRTGKHVDMMQKSFQTAKC